MQMLYERQDIIKNYNRCIKVRKDGSVECKVYTSPITTLDSGIEHYDKEFFETCDIRKRKCPEGCRLLVPPRIVYIDGKRVVQRYEKIVNNSPEGVVNNLNDFIKNLEKEEKTCEQNIRYDSLSRSRQLLIDYACENHDKFHSFVTLTFGDQITDVDVANKCFVTWKDQISRYCKKNSGQFYYLGVPEFQKNGRVHYHVLTSLKHDQDIEKRELKRLWNPSERKYKEIEYYDLKYWNHGFSSSFDIDGDTDDNFNVALYITKYLYKDLDHRLFGRKKVLKSNNLEKPNVYKLDENSVIYKTAMQYIDDLFLKNKIEIQSSVSIEPTEDKPYLKKQNILHFKLQDDDNILKEIMQDNLEF